VNSVEDNTDYRLSIVEARAKLEILKALGSDDPERSIQIFFAEVEVAMLGSDPEKVLHPPKFPRLT